MTELQHALCYIRLNIFLPYLLSDHGHAARRYLRRRYQACHAGRNPK